MTDLVDTVIEDDRWQGFGLAEAADRAARAVLADLGLPVAGFEIVVMGCSDARIAALNGSFRDKDRPTNVLSWPSDERGSDVAGTAPDLPEPGPEDDPEPLGDIAIAWETCMAEAAEQGKTPGDHVVHLLVHAMLHLLGYDHIDDSDATLMEATETRILAGLGIADPY